MIEVTPATLDDIEEIIPRLRQSDRNEVRKAAGALDAPLRQSLQSSDEAYSFRVDGLLVCIAGVVPRSRLSGIGIPWQIGTDELGKYAKTMCRNNRHFIDKWLETYRVLENYVDEENKTSQRWLKWLGFELEEPEEYGKLGHLFRRFHIERN